MTVAVFDYATWAQRYPAVALYTDAPLAEAIFAESSLFCDNTDASPIPCDAVTYQPRLMYLGMVVAHIAELGRPATAGGSGLVGRIASATQGSVSVTADMGAQPRSAAWWNQTQPGASFWASTARYRTFQYSPRPATTPYYPLRRPW
jgi:hypothetical protein